MHVRDKWVRGTTAWCVLGLRTEDLPPIWKVAANILNKQSWTADKDWSSSFGLCEVLSAPHLKKPGIVTKLKPVPRAWTDTLVRPKQWKTDMRFGTWNVRSLFMSGSLNSSSQGISKV